MGTISVRPEWARVVLLVDQLGRPRMADAGDHDQADADKDQGNAVAAAIGAARRRIKSFCVAAGEAACAIASTITLNFSMTKPKAITARPVRVPLFPL